MARPPRLCVPGHVHWVQQAALAPRLAFLDDTDRAQYRAALRESAAAAQVRLHAYALLPDAVHLLLTPASVTGLSQLMQGVGRRYVSAHHRRHGGSGTLWEGRFRAAPVERGALCLGVMQLIESLPAEPTHGSAPHHLGHADRQVPLADLPELWSLGNTPFERESAWRDRLAEGLPPAQGTAWMQQARSGWPLGSPAYAAQLAQVLGRPTAPRPAGRPRRQA